jgi:hypothetical protein
MTMIELARSADSGVPRILASNHHPEIVDRDHIMQVLDEKRTHGEVDDKWYREREYTLTRLLDAETERQSRLTSHFTLLGPIRQHLGRLVRERSV